jgi:hypothetical protein
MVRRLPVLQNQIDEPSRPAWQWVLLGAGFMISLWIPLLALALWLRSRLAPESMLGHGATFSPVSTSRGVGFVLALGPVLVPWMLASALTAVLLVRFGAPRVTRRHAIYSGLAATLLVCAVAALGRSFDSWVTFFASVLLLAAASAGPGWFAGKFGIKRQVSG